MFRFININDLIDDKCYKILIGFMFFLGRDFCFLVFIVFLFDWIIYLLYLMFFVFCVEFDGMVVKLLNFKIVL